MNERLKLSLFFALILSGIGLRFLCRDIPNFAPVGAAALFAGFLFSSRIVAALVPISILVVTNWYLGGYESWIVMVTVYACFLLPVFLGNKLLKSEHLAAAPVGPVITLSLTSSFLFFFVTNYSSWLLWYPRNWAGFVECYVNALPFFRFTLMGDLFFSFLFFGVHAMLVRMSGKAIATEIAVAPKLSAFNQKADLEIR